MRFVVVTNRKVENLINLRSLSVEGCNQFFRAQIFGEI